MEMFLNLFKTPQKPLILPVMMSCGHYACKCENCMNNHSEINCGMCIEHINKQNVFNEFEDKFKSLFKEFKGKNC